MTFVFSYIFYTKSRRIANIPPKPNQSTIPVKVMKSGHAYTAWNTKAKALSRIKQVSHSCTLYSPWGIFLPRLGPLAMPAWRLAFTLCLLLVLLLK